MRAMVLMGAVVVYFATLAACASDAPLAPPPSPGPVTATLDSVTRAALADAAQRTGLKRADLKVLSAEAVTWSDGSLGCPRPGMLYTQALVPGYRVRIQAGAEVLEYHASRIGRAALCPADRVQPPLPDDRV